MPPFFHSEVSPCCFFVPVEIGVIYSENETISVHLAPNEESSARGPGFVAANCRTKGAPGVGNWKRGRYKNYSESDLLKAVEIVLAGNSLKRATEATGVPQSTITDRMAKMNLTKRRRRGEEHGGGEGEQGTPHSQTYSANEHYSPM